MNVTYTSPADEPWYVGLFTALTWLFGWTTLFLLIALF